MTVMIFHYWRRCWLGTSPLFRGVSYSSDGSLAIVLDIVKSHNDCLNENSKIHPPRQLIDDHDDEAKKTYIDSCSERTRVERGVE